MADENEINPTEETANDVNTVSMSLYEVNRQIIKQLPTFSGDQWSGAYKVLDDWTSEMQNEYFLLYGREINYFTLFKRTPECQEELYQVLKECLDSIGPVHAFDVTEDKSAVEIWVEHDNEVTCLYLFNYDDGVVAFG